MDAPSPHPVVVVVDDDIALRTALAFSLELEGFSVDARGSGEELLNRPLPAGASCLVLDERLPGIGGLETLRALRWRGVELPAVLITTNPRAALRAAARGAGVPIVEKPLVGDALVESIRAALAA
jgi:FixJ family two-component response regulator